MCPMTIMSEIWYAVSIIHIPHVSVFNSLWITFSRKKMSWELFLIFWGAPEPIDDIEMRFYVKTRNKYAFDGDEIDNRS